MSTSNYSMEFTTYLNTLSRKEIYDLDPSEFINIVKYGSIYHLSIYASNNSMSLIHCAIVILLRESVYPEFLLAADVRMTKVIKTMHLLRPCTCGEILKKYGLTDPGFNSNSAYIEYLTRLLSIDPVSEKIQGNEKVDITDISDKVTKKYLTSKQDLEVLVDSILS